MTPRQLGQGRQYGPDHVLFLVVLGVTSLAAALWVDRVAISAESGLAQAIGFTAAFFVSRLLTIRLPQGDEVYVTLLVGLCAIATLDIGVVMAASLVAGLVDSIARFSQSPRPVAIARALDAVRGTAVIGLMAPWQLLLQRGAGAWGSGDAVIGWVLLAGLAYAAVDVVTVAVQLRISGGLPAMKGVVTLLRPLSSVYLVHLSMAAVVVRLNSASSVWAFPIALLLTLILQNSFNLYLRIRRGYAETISALAHAAELDRPHDSGHARRVADLSVAVGRRMGLSSHDLERIGYAALLHDIGRIGDGSSRGEAHVRRGADIVASIPFLADVAPLIDWRSESDRAEPPVGALIVRTCSQYDRLRAEIGAAAALQALSLQEGTVDGDVVMTLGEIIRSHRVRDGARL